MPSQLRLDSGPSGVVGDLLPRDLPSGFGPALARAMEAVEKYHAPQVHEGYKLESSGIRLEERMQPFGRVALYVPGGRHPLFSSAVMSVIPARLAGVSEIVVVTPPRAFASSAALRYTLSQLEVDEVWGMGGAHAIAALAYGTETIEAVDFIAGPGNAYVAAAKRLVEGHVGIDREAGPSEVVIVAGGDAPPDLVAADLLAQAEHDPNAMAVVVTPDRRLARRVVRYVDQGLELLGTREVAQAALRSRGLVLLVDEMDEALQVAERLAPEHLQLIGERAEWLEPEIRSAGAIFVGKASPVVLGDYVAGPSHVLPTGGSARFASGLGVGDFVRRCHTVRFTEEAVEPWARAAAVLAATEGLEAHARSALLRAGEESAGLELLDEGSEDLDVLGDDEGSS